MKEIKTEDELSRFIDENEKCLVKFSAVWCGPCRQLQPILEDLEIQEVIKISEVNIDEAGDLAMKYNIRSVPSTFIFENKEIKNMFVGVKSAQEILDLYNA